MAKDIKTAFKGQDDRNSPKSLDDMQKGAAMIREGLEQGAYELGGKVKQELDKGQEYIEGSLQSLEEQVKSHPLLSVSVSFLLGMMIAKLISSK
jgi:hypothetical protein